MRTLQKYSRTILFSAVAGLASGPAMAQLLLEEIIVTAQKREATLSDTPIAITALSSDQLNALGIYSQQDIANFTPSMSYEENAGGGESNRIYLRGIGRETASTGTEPGVGVYDNGFYTNEAGVLQGSVDRIERIEILRGPQGTLFGRNTTGGAINIVSKRPGDDFEHIARVRLGNYDTQNIELTTSGPITDKVGYLLHYASLEQDSFFENVTGPDPIGIDADYIEAQLDIDFTDNINWNLRYTSPRFENETMELAKLSGYRNEPGAPSKLGEIVINPELFAPLAVAPAERDPFKLSSDFKGSVEVEDQYAYQSTLTIDLESVQIKMLNGYLDADWFGSKDFDGTASPVSYLEIIGQDEKSKQHEIQFISNSEGDVDWVVGLFYYQNELYQPYTLSDPNNPYLINNISGADNPGGIFYTQLGEVETTSKAIYGQFEWRATDRLTLSAGMRYSEDEKDGFESQQIFFDTGIDGCGDGAVPDLIAAGPYASLPACPRIGLQITNAEDDHDTEKWDAVNWRLNASYDIVDDSLVYATIATGYKPGGFRLGALQDIEGTPKNESIVDNEEVTAYEIGFKGTVNDKLSISSAIFYYDYEDMQVELAILDERSGIITSKLDNAPSTEIYGLEIESTWAVTENLTLLGNYSYLSSEYKDDFFVSDNKTDEVRNVKGNELNRTPNHKFSFAFYYTQPLDNGNIVLTGNYSYIDKQFMTVFNDDIETVDSYEQVNARISWKPHSGSYEVAVFGTNLTDELSYANRLAVTGLDDGVRQIGRPINPRVYGVELALFF